MLLGITPSALTAGQALAFTSAVPMTVLSPFRATSTNFAITGGMVIPALQLSTVSYKFGVKADASQTFTLKGDSIFFIEGGAPYEDVFTGDGTTSTWTLAHTASAYFNNSLGVTQYVLNVSVTNTDGSFYRLFNGAGFDYTDTATTLTLNAGVAAPASGATIRVAYCAIAAETIAQSANNADGITVKPAALRSRDIQVWLGTNAATPVFSRMSGVQSFDATFECLSLQATEEFGNPLVVSQDYTIPQVSGTITTRDSSVAALFAKIYAMSGVSSAQVVGALSSANTPLPMEIHLNDPNTGARIKTLYCPDAVFDPPDVSARVNQLIETPHKWLSNSGSWTVYNGARPGGVATA
jgi:hypothetical protein